MNKLICLVGMTGSGKSVVADYLVKNGFGFFRFGQITLDIVKERGLEPIDKNEKPIREEVRKKHGMGAYAILNMPKIEELLKKGHVVGDGMYSWSEYKVLKEKYTDQFVTVAIYAPPKERYARLLERTLEKKDVDLRHRPATKKQAKERDYAEIENIEKGGPIAMAEYTLINTGEINDLFKKVDQILERLLIK
ncbi:MAG: AAA family ATPase [Candidatus Diapherotrites archaeon]|jgi:dephospho-CoA kinase|uniref:AAA family ATPase n=1 Tax=Candidatus Iainarchaeum sp. TaxID=3101447 RepID=A0A8T5GDZ0_9ARCH|nr:AAA family ATPase [Candidatus Diapherotrites archaeon]MBT7240983.1 AAA family ATPase [Candidatus Diapherotrites archaeon]